MKKFTYLIVSLLLLPVMLMASSPKIQNLEEQNTQKIQLNLQKTSQQTARQAAFEQWVEMGRPMTMTTPNKTAAEDISINFDFFKVGHSGPTQYTAFDTYTFKLTGAGYAGTIEFLGAPNGPADMPVGTYTVQENAAENTVSQGMAFMGFTFGSYVQKIENDAPTATYMFVSGDLVVTNISDNAKHIHFEGTVVDDQGNNLMIVADHEITEEDMYSEEPTDLVQYDMALPTLKNQFAADKHFNRVILMNDTINVYLDMIRDAAATDAQLPTGTFNIDATGDVNSFKKSPGFDADGYGSPCLVIINQDQYPLVSGTVTITEKTDATGYTVAVDATTFRGSTFKFNGEQLYADVPFQDEGAVVNKTLEITKVTDKRINTDMTAALDTFSVQFQSADYLVALLATANHSTDTVLPNGTYNVALPLADKTVQKSVGLLGEYYQMSVVAGGFDYFGRPSIFYFIEQGTMTKADDTAHAGEYIYTFNFTTHFGSTFQSTYNTYVDPYGPETDIVTAYDEAWTAVTYKHYPAQADQGDQFDIYSMDITDKENAKMIRLFINTGLGSPDAIPAGTYTFADVPAENTIVPGHVATDGSGKLAPSVAVVGKGDDAKYYFLISGTCVVEYPEANNTEHIKVTLDAMTAKGSSFKITVDYVLNPYEGYTFEYEPETATTINLVPNKLELNEITKITGAYWLRMSTDTTECDLLLFTGKAGLKEAPEGDYTVNSSENDMTIFESHGVTPDGYIDGSFYGKSVNGQIGTPIYHIVSGTLKIEKTSSKTTYTYNVTTHFGSTIQGTYEVIKTGIETTETNGLNAFVENGNIIIENATQNVEVYNALGQLVASSPIQDGKTIISGLSTSQVYIVRSGDQVIKLNL